MSQSNRTHVFKALRNQHPVLIYESFNIITRPEEIRIIFTFNLSGNIAFHPELVIPLPKSGFGKLNEDELHNLVFHIGMVELISYWKAACPPRVVIKPYKLSEQQKQFWKKLWYFGLGEFFYTNGIETAETDFLEIICESDKQIKGFSFNADKRVLVPVGGGKDSVVTMELLKKARKQFVPFIMNPRPASIKSAKQAGFQENDILTVKRTLDKQLLELNDKDYLNGHTPFSALLAFITLLVSGIHGISDIALSNESSANEPTIPDTKINHQYSKSFDFESDFRAYIHDFISPDFNYFSFLRPLNELQIAMLFSQHPHHFETFRSCNVGSKTDAWCGKCPKCLFTRIIMGPFIPAKKMVEIFDSEILDDPDLKQIFDELTGIADEKPFECVGTVDEVNAAIKMMLSAERDNGLPWLLKNYKKQKSMTEPNPDLLLMHFNHNHFLKPEFEKIIKTAIL